MAAREEASRELARQWRTLSRMATFVAVLTAPAVYLYVDRRLGWDWRWALLTTFGAVIAFRGFVDVVFRRMIPWPSLFGTDATELRAEDVLARRRAWFWRKWIRRAVLVLAAFTVAWLILSIARGFDDTSFTETVTDFWVGAWGIAKSPATWAYVLLFPVLFLFNFVILFGRS